jgi:hypothetical protein
MLKIYYYFSLQRIRIQIRRIKMLSIPEQLPDDSALYRKMIDAALSRLRVAAPGIIQSFNATKQTAEVKIAIREHLNINGNLSWVEIPLLVDVPVYFPRAGGYCLTVPISAGDECLVIFADFCIDAWWQSGGIQNQVDKRRHDLSDGFALVGVTSQPKKVSGYSPNTVQLRNEAGNAVVEIDGTTINVTTSGIANVTGNSINVSGSNISVSGGNVSIGSNTTIDGKGFLSHTHSGVKAGDSTTGGVA